MMLRRDFLLACGSTILASTLRGGVPGRARCWSDKSALRTCTPPAKCFDQPECQQCVQLPAGAAALRNAGARPCARVSKGRVRLAAGRGRQGRLIVCIRSGAILICEPHLVELDSEKPDQSRGLVTAVARHARLGRLRGGGTAGAAAALQEGRGANEQSRMVKKLDLSSFLGFAGGSGGCPQAVATANLPR